MSYGEIKYALNSTVGTDEFVPLDQQHGRAVFTVDGEFKPPVNGTYWITAIAAGTNGENGKRGVKYRSGSNGNNNPVPSIGGKSGELIEKYEVTLTVGHQVPIVVGNGNTVIGEVVTLLVGGGLTGNIGIAKNFVESYPEYENQARNKFIIRGTDGSWGESGQGNYGAPGGNGGTAGGSSIFGPGGNGGRGGKGSQHSSNAGDYNNPLPGGNGTDGVAYGTGGGAGGNGGNVTESGDASKVALGGTGGKGAPGIVIIEW